MSKKKKKSIPVVLKKEQEPLKINMNQANLKKLFFQPSFKTGKYMTEKDRPRKKNSYWKNEKE